MTAYAPFRPMVEVLKPGSLGDVKLSRFTVSEETAKFSQLRAVVTQGREHPVRPGDYMQLYVGSTLMMSDTQMEQLSNMDVIRQARGEVLIAGLGIGMILLPILANPEVTKVTVIEKYEHVVNLVAPTIMEQPGGEKLTVIHADVFYWKPPRGSRWDTIYFDIWPDICEDDLDQQDELHNYFKKYRASGGWMGSWQRQYLQHRRSMRADPGVKEP